MKPDVLIGLSGSCTSDRLIDDIECAYLLGKKPQTLRNARCSGDLNYPPFYVVGRHVRYRLSEVWAFIENKKRTNTLQA